MELRQVLLALGQEWSAQEKELEERLLAEGVRCIRPGGERPVDPEKWLCSAASAAGKDEMETVQAVGEGGTETAPAAGSSAEPRRRRTDGLDAADTLVVTDDRQLTAALTKRGFVCVGCDDGEGRFFEGAALVTDAPGAFLEGAAPVADAPSLFFEGAVLVTDAPETLDACTLEECLLRGTGRPVTIAVTDTLIIREITEQDIPGLQRIGRQDGMRMAMEDADGDCLEPERLSAYIRHAYRFCGYGLWSVLLRDGTLIGCCGFRDFTEDCSGWQESSGQEKAAGQTETAGIDGNIRHAQREDELSTRLELQYAVAKNYRRQGYGEEMCRAALEYARSRLHADEVWARVKKGNRASEALAEKLEFHWIHTDGSGTEFYRLG